MTRPTSQDLLLALLALDAYNRGPDGSNRKFEEKGGNAIQETVGAATWVYDASEISGSAASGFSASYYTLSSGEKVIAYRGTDFPNGSNLTSEFVKDIALGWLQSFDLAPPNATAGYTAA
jgi:hypothetical protein